MKLKKAFIATLAMGIAFLPITSQACTSIAITDKQGNVYHGRTLEYSNVLKSFITYYPQGYTFKNIAPNDHEGLSYQAKYKIMGITMPMIDDNDRTLVEGLNDQGLSFSANMYSLSDPGTVDEKDYSRSLPLPKIGEWALANFKTVDEVKQAIEVQPVWSPIVQALQLKGLNSPLHFVFYDKQGKSIVIEYTKGKLNVYDNPTLVMTNGPEFSWHLTNLNNYTMLTNKDIPSSKLGNIELKEPDTGNATTALPSSDTSVGRFVRAVFYSTYAKKADNPDQQVIELSHVINKFDRPQNITLDQNGEEYTTWSTLSDTSRGILWFKPYNSMSYEKFSFDEFSKKDKFFIKQGM